MKKVAIPEKMQRFYGAGTMLHPDQEMVEALLEAIPQGKVTTIEKFCEKLGRDYGTTLACPMRTSNFVKGIATTSSGSDISIPFWRVIRNNHLLINSPWTQASVLQLTEEGVDVIRTNKGDFKVLDVENRLFEFD